MRSAPSSSAEQAPVLDAAFLKKIEHAVITDHRRTLRDLMKNLNPSETAMVLSNLSPELRPLCVHFLGKRFNGLTFLYLDANVTRDLIVHFPHDALADIISALESDDAVQIFNALTEEEKEDVFALISPRKRALISSALHYGKDSAGRMMQREIVTIPESWTVNQVVRFLHRERDTIPEKFFNLFVIDRHHKLQGKVGLSYLLRAKPETPVKKIMRKDFKPVDPHTDQEEVALLFRTYDLVEVPVVDKNGRLLGAITVDDIHHITEKEAQEDILRFVGVGSDDFYANLMRTSRSRLPWLLVNLLTASLSATVISFFSSSIEQIVALAALMPMVASISGNSGTQTMAVTVRALAARELLSGGLVRQITKEVLVGMTNGILFALITSILCYLWFRDGYIASTFGLSILAALTLANLVGILIPVAFWKAKLDPAIGSSVFLTAVTDIVSFTTFLGLATVMMLS